MFIHYSFFIFLFRFTLLRHNFSYLLFFSHHSSLDILFLNQFLFCVFYFSLFSSHFSVFPLIVFLKSFILAPYSRHALFYIPTTVFFSFHKLLPITFSLDIFFLSNHCFLAFFSHPNDSLSSWNHSLEAIH